MSPFQPRVGTDLKAAQRTATGALPEPARDANFARQAAFR
jgi:hypothetical protein